MSVVVPALECHFVPPSLSFPWGLEGVSVAESVWGSRLENPWNFRWPQEVQDERELENSN